MAIIALMTFNPLRHGADFPTHGIQELMYPDQRKMQAKEESAMVTKMNKREMDECMNGWDK